MREVAVEVLHHSGNLTPEVVDKLMQILRTDSHENVRRGAVSALRDAVPKPVGLPELLIAALGDSDYMVRGRAFMALTECLPGWRDSDEGIIAKTGAFANL